MTEVVNNEQRSVCLRYVSHSPGGVAGDHVVMSLRLWCKLHSDC